MYMFAEISPFLFLLALALSLLFDTTTRKIIHRSDNNNYLHTGLSIICDFFFIIVLYSTLSNGIFVDTADNVDDDVDYTHFKKLNLMSFFTLFFTSISKVMSPST